MFLSFPFFFSFSPKGLEVHSPFFSTIVLFTNQLFPWGSHGFLERRIPGKHGEVSPREGDPCWDQNGGHGVSSTSRRRKAVFARRHFATSPSTAVISLGRRRQVSIPEVTRESLRFGLACEGKTFGKQSHFQAVLPPLWTPLT